MLTSLHVQNFKCLRDVQLALGPFTVLIGPNDSGKSSILDAIRLVGRTVVEPVPNVFCDDNDRRQLAWKQTREPHRFDPIRFNLMFHRDSARTRSEYVLTLWEKTAVESVSNTLASGIRSETQPHRVGQRTLLQECFDDQSAV